MILKFFLLPTTILTFSMTWASADDAEKTRQIELGKKNYITCSACHGMDGKGLKAGPMVMAPSLVGSKLLLGDPELAVAIVLNGIQKEDAKYAGLMAPLGAAFDDEKLAAVLTYVRNSFGNTAPAISVEQVKDIREKYKDHPMWKRAELEKALEEKNASTGVEAERK